MARRRSDDGYQNFQSKDFTKSEIDRGIRKLRRRIEEVEGIDPMRTEYGDAKVKTVEANIHTTILEVFGERSPEYWSHGSHHIWYGSFNVMDTDLEERQKFSKGIPQTVIMLQGLISRLEERRDDLEEDAEEDLNTETPKTGSVFVVHGRDEAAKQEVSTFLKEIGLKPVVLHEQANQGRTVIEKFEGHATVDFAVVLLTPDDEGKIAGSAEQPRPRARQNVIFELGFFVARLGRPRVCALHKADVEILSDYEGVLYVPMDTGQGWKLRLAKEIKASGIEIDLNKVL